MLATPPDAGPPPEAVAVIEPPSEPAPSEPAVADSDPVPVTDEAGGEEESGADPRARAEMLAQLIRQANYARSHGDGDAAESGYLHVLRLDRANARALAGMARLYQSRSEPRTALFWARRLTTLHPEMPGNHVLLGDILEATGDHAGARAAWEHALALQPGYRSARRRLGGDTSGGDGDD